MTHAQIGAPPFKACAHTDNRPGCHICANYDAVKDQGPARVIETREPDTSDADMRGWG